MPKMPSLRTRIDNYLRKRRKKLNNLEGPMSKTPKVVYLASNRPIDLNSMSAQILKLKSKNHDWMKMIANTLEQLLQNDIWEEEAANVYVSTLRALYSNDTDAGIKFGHRFRSRITDHRASKTLVKMLLKKNMKEEALEILRPFQKEHWAMQMSIEMIVGIHKEKGFEEHYLDLVGRNVLLEDPKPAILLYGDVNMNIIDGSSVWLASTAEAFTGCGFEIHILLKTNITRGVLINHLRDIQGIRLIEPSHFGIHEGELDVKTAVSLIETLDGIIGGYRTIVLRGLNLCAQAAGSKSLWMRIWGYLTDYYLIDPDLGRIGKENIEELIEDFSHVFDRFLVQTEEMKRDLIENFGVAESLLSLFPPIIPDHNPPRVLRNEPTTLRIGYCGKIAPLWGVRELIEVTGDAISKGFNIEVHIIGDKIHRSTPANPGFREDMTTMLDNTPHVTWHGAMTRKNAMLMMSTMDIAWCYRSNELELETLELSTKLLENMAIGLPIMLTRNSIHEELLGSDYPLFIDDIGDLPQILENVLSNIIIDSIDYESLRDIAQQHSMSNVRKKIVEPLVNELEIFDSSKKRIVINGHDLKFIGEFESHLKRLGHLVKRDRWEWADPIDGRRSTLLVSWGEIIFSEWGLGNAVWYSQHIQEHQHHVIRIHLQEINQRARRFPPNIDVDNVDNIIVVAEHVRQEAVELFSWQNVRTSTLPNYVDVDRHEGVKIPTAAKTLGIIGIVPQRKRFDRALDVLEILKSHDDEWRLIVKGKQPHDIPFMHGPSRREELQWYDRQYDRLAPSSDLKESVIFEGYTTTIASWYRKIGYILSPSEFESFHFSIADGVSSGSYPVIWPWEGATDIYPKTWTIKDSKEAAKKILKHSRGQDKGEVTRREFIRENYGMQSVFARLRETMGLE